jgi:hypothetical protein
MDEAAVEGVAGFQTLFAGNYPKQTGICIHNHGQQWQQPASFFIKRYSRARSTVNETEQKDNRMPPVRHVNPYPKQL